MSTKKPTSQQSKTDRRAATPPRRKPTATTPHVQKTLFDKEPRDESNR